MRILAITFSLSLIGCIDDVSVDQDPTDETLDDIDPNDSNTDPRPTGDTACASSQPGGGLTPVPPNGDDRDRADRGLSRKKADGACF